MPGGKKCAFISCTSTKTRNSPLRFFKFPVNNSDVCELWIKNCANETLINLPQSALRSRVVCERHFEKSCFKNPSRCSKLRTDVVPAIFNPISEEQELLQVQANDLTSSGEALIPEAANPQPPLTWFQQQSALPMHPSTTQTLPPLPPAPPAIKRMKMCPVSPQSTPSPYTPATRARVSAAQPEPTPVPSTSGVANTATSSVPSQPHVKPYVPVQVDVRAKPHVPVPSDLRPTLTPAVVKKPPTTPELDSLPPPSLENDSSISVKWNTYATNMSSVMPSLLEDEKFVDVTLACDGKYIKCHKVILGACSPYFEELLYVNPCQHPIILMKDFQFWEIRAIVDFIYRGVVNIPQHQLPKLLQVANVLQIKGLTGTRNENESEEDVRLADHSRDSQSQVGNKLRKRSELSPTEQTSRSKTSPSPAKKMKIISTSSSRHSFESHTSDESSNQSDVSQSTSSAVAVSLEPSTLLHSVCIKEETNYGVDDPPDCTYTSDQNEDKGNFSQLGQFQQLTLPGSRTIKQEVNEDMMEATDQDPLDLESGVS